MDYNDVTRLENELIAGLKEEYTFYQSLFIVVDKQRDHIKYEREHKLVDLYAEVERIINRINQSEAKIAALRDKNRELFNLAASAPEVRRLVGSITTLISKTLKLVKENEETASSKYEAIKEQLRQLQQGQRISEYLQTQQNSPQFVDKRN